VLYVPVLQRLFRFSPLDLTELAVCLAAGVVSVLWFEVLKALGRRHRRRHV
jgi:Ca2+-transporting ATPase